MREEESRVEESRGEESRGEEESREEESREAEEARAGGNYLLVGRTVTEGLTASKAFFPLLIAPVPILLCAICI